MYFTADCLSESRMLLKILYVYFTEQAIAQPLHSESCPSVNKTLGSQSSHENQADFTGFIIQGQGSTAAAPQPVWSKVSL